MDTRPSDTKLIRNLVTRYLDGLNVLTPGNAGQTDNDVVAVDVLGDIAFAQVTSPNKDIGWLKNGLAIVRFEGSWRILTKASPCAAL
jgi:hypothetical protein